MINSASATTLATRAKLSPPPACLDEWQQNFPGRAIFFSQESTQEDVQGRTQFPIFPRLLPNKRSLLDREKKKPLIGSPKKGSPTSYTTPQYLLVEFFSIPTLSNSSFAPQEPLLFRHISSMNFGGSCGSSSSSSSSSSFQ